MSSKTWSSGTVIDSAWLQDVNDSVYGPTAPLTTLRGQLVDLTTVTNGSARVGYKPSYLNGVARLLNLRLEDWKTLKDFGAVGDNSTDDTTAIQNAINSGYTIYVPPGTYKHGALTGLARSGLTIIGAGSTSSAFRYTGTGTAWSLDASAGNFAQNVCLSGFTITGNSSVTTILQCKKLARCQFSDINLKEADTTSGIGLLLQGTMLSKFERITCSQDLQSMTSAPSEGLRLEATGDGNSSNNTFISCYFEGAGAAVSNTISIGIRISGGDQNLFMGGSPESCKLYGLLISDTSRYNTFIGVGFENLNSTADIGDGGKSSKFINCYSSNKVLLQGQGAEIDGGYYERIQVDAGALHNIVHNVRLNNWRTGNGGFYDSGTATEFKNLFGTTLTATFAADVMTVTAIPQGTLKVGQVVVAEDVTTGTTITSFGTGTGGTGTYNLSTTPGNLSSRAVCTEAYVFPFLDRQSIVVGASPFVWKNETGQYVELIIQSGTVTQVRQLRGTDAWLKSVSVPGQHIVPPSDSIEISYSALPVVNYVPHNGFQG